VRRVVLKLGGRVAAGAAAQAHALVESGHEVVVVHGAGPQISQELVRRGLEPVFTRGRRVTTAEVLVVVRESMATVNAQVCAALGDRALGLSGDEIGLPAARIASLGLVGEPAAAAPGAVVTALEQGRIPVVAPLCVDPEGEVLNVNADEAAAALAVGLGADRILFVSDVPGVLVDGEVVGELQVDQADLMLGGGAFEGGIVPKLVAAVHAARGGVPAAIGATEVVA
jgi:acetylglutamate kinase